MFFVYILFSEKLQKFYIGTTDNVDRRLIEHNDIQYQNSFTSKGIPWDLYLSITCETSQLAYKLEAFIKKMKSSTFVRRLKNDQAMIDSIIKKIKTGEIS